MAALLLLGDCFLSQGQISLYEPNNKKKILWAKTSVSVDAKGCRFWPALEVLSVLCHRLGVKELLFAYIIIVFT